MGGFGDWVETVVESKSAVDYRRRYSEGETSSVWQSLGYGPNYKAAYCMAVCPAGEDLIGPFLDDRKSFLKTVVEPLQQKEETLYVIAGSDAQVHARKRFPHKKTKIIHNGLRPSSIRAFLANLPRVFQRHQSHGLSASYHFTFTGVEPALATVVIRDKTIRVEQGHQGAADLHVVADSQTWLGFVRRERSLVWALLTRRFRLKGSARLLLAFGKCFPS
jgi:hypothetical protein